MSEKMCVGDLVQFTEYDNIMPAVPRIFRKSELCKIKRIDAEGEFIIAALLASGRISEKRVGLVHKEEIKRVIGSPRQRDLLQ